MKKPRRINTVSVAFVVAALLVGYAAYAFIPIYWPIFQMEGIIRGICNDAYRELNNDRLMDKLLAETKRTGLKLSKDNFRMKRIPYDQHELDKLGIGDAAAPTLVEQRGKAFEIAYRYRDTYSLPLIGQTLTLTFEDTLSTSLETVQY